MKPHRVSQDGIGITDYGRTKLSVLRRYVNKVQNNGGADGCYLWLNKDIVTLDKNEAVELVNFLIRFNHFNLKVD